MIGILAIGVALISIGVGFIIKKWTDAAGTTAQITKTEFIIGAIVIALVVSPLTTYVGYQSALKSRITYQQFLNGCEQKVSIESVQCFKNGICSQSYACDPHLVPYSCGTSKAPATCYRVEYDQCPYVDYEYRYWVYTTLGNYVFDEGRLPLDPQAHRWRRFEEIPLRVIREAGVGDPMNWYQVKLRVDSGRPGPVTKIASYDNFILASNTTVLKQWSAKARELDSLKLLPPLTKNIVGFYDADKVSAKAVNVSGWSQRLAYLNSVAGAQLSADVRLVVVRTTLGADEFTFALLANWQNEEKWGRMALPKNVMVFVIGTEDGKTVSWARGATGMPLGNEAIQATARTAFLRKPLDVDSIIGSTHWETDGVTRAVHGSGVIEQLVFGLTNPDTKFERISMSTFMYLKGEIKPSTGGWWAMGVATLVACCIVWVIFLFVGAPRLRQWQSQFYSSWR